MTQKGDAREQISRDSMVKHKLKPKCEDKGWTLLLTIERANEVYVSSAICFKLIPNERSLIQGVFFNWCPSKSSKCQTT